MSRDELSIVLLKLFGFTVVASSLLALPQSIGYYIFLFIDSPTMGPQMATQIFILLVGVAVQVIGGMVVIVKAPAISKWLFALGQGSRNTKA
jgi:hypothetical protein